MNYTQNQKIEQVTESTLVLGVDIGSSEHYVRAFDYRGRELTRKVFRFSTDINGFNSFYDWVTQICIKHGKNEAMIGCEPTGHYWYTCLLYTSMFPQNDDPVPEIRFNSFTTEWRKRTLGSCFEERLERCV